MRFVVGRVFTRRYRIKVLGLNQLPEQGGVLLLGNHVSWIDWAIIQIASPRPIRFVMIKNIYQIPFLKWFFDLFGAISIEPGASSKDSLEKVADLLNQGEVVCLFPEGTLSRTGHLAEFRHGYERACEKCHDDVVIVPFYLRGLWGSQFSRATKQQKVTQAKTLKRDLVVAFGKPISKDIKADELKQHVFDLSVSSWNDYSATLPRITEAWIDTVKRCSNNTAISDERSGTLSASKALAGAITLSRTIKQQSSEQNIGILLPSSIGGMLTNMATLIAGKTIVNLNYTASMEAQLSAIEQAQIKTLYTSKTFIKKLELKGMNIDGLARNCKVIYLEDVKASTSKFKSLLSWLAVKILPAAILKPLCSTPSKNNTAAILFSSGSEGAPKGVKLSHQNILANAKQITEVLNTQEGDVLLASLPLFHAFGLTVTQFLPLVEGLPIVCEPDPTDVLSGAKAIARHQVTIMFGTSTFYRLYTRNSKVHPLMLKSLRLCVAGAEKLHDKVRDDFQLKFNKPLFEGYGATETNNRWRALTYLMHWTIKRGKYS